MVKVMGLLNLPVTTALVLLILILSNNPSSLTWGNVLNGNGLPTMGGYPASSGGYPDSNPGTAYGAPNPYIPAPSGETPTCAKNGQTFCEHVETYPTMVIRYLLDKWGHTYREFIKSEIDREFYLMSQSYGVPQGGYSYTAGGYSDSSPGPGGYPSLTYESLNSSQNSGFNQQPAAQSFNTPQQQHYNAPQQPQQNHNNGGYNTINFAAAAIPPILQSYWWNHHAKDTAKPSYPYIMAHRIQRRRTKRQTPSESQLCPVRSQFITPQAAMNNRGNWMWVVNMEDQRFIQQVKSEICATGDGSPCSGLCTVAPGFRASCRQQYVQKRLVALSESGDRLRNDVFWFPHCCVCQVT